MFEHRSALAVFVLCLLWSVWGAGCGDSDQPGCREDSDCRAGRVCVVSVCQDPEGGTTGGGTTETGGTSTTSTSGTSTTGGTSTTSGTSTGGTSTSGTGVDVGVDADVDEDTGEPDIIEDTGEPDIIEDTGEPDIIEDVPDDTGEPDIIEDTGEPDATEPDTSEPDAEDDTGEPDVIEDTGEPDVVEDVEDDTSEPDVVDDTGPDAEPDTGEPDVVEDTSPDVEEDSGPDPLDGTFLAVSPDAIDFGEVGQFVSAFEDVVLTNIGTEVVNIESVRLRAEPSQGFQLIAPPDAPSTLESGESATWRVRFRPTVIQNNGPTQYGNAVLVDSNDEENPSVVIELAGTGVPEPERCLTFTRNVVDFGFVEPGNVEAETIELANCGNSDLSVSDVSFAEQVQGLNVTSGVSFPTQIPAGDRLSLALTYAPANVDPIQVSLVAEGDGGVVAEAVVRAGAECPNAVAIGSVEGGAPTRDDLEGFVGNTFTFSGVLSDDPSDGDLEYTWVVEGPEGSEELNIDPDLQSEQFSFVPDVPGSYQVTLSVRSTASGVDSCEVDVMNVRAVGTDSAVDVSVTWANIADMDLHVLRSDENGEFGEFGSSQNVVEDDIYFANPRPDFGVLGDTTDDPWFQGDDRNGFGPERTLIPVLEDGRRYKVGVNFAVRNFAPQANATLTLIVGGDELTYDRTWNEVGVYWIPVIIESDGSVTEVDELE